MIFYVDCTKLKLLEGTPKYISGEFLIIKYQYK